MRGAAGFHMSFLGIRDRPEAEPRTLYLRIVRRIDGYFPNASTGLGRLQSKRQSAKNLARPKDNRTNAGFSDEEREDFREYLAEVYSGTSGISSISSRSKRVGGVTAFT
jgi:hypothetical protein